MNCDVPLQLWGGVECSVVRIGTGTRDQLVETGHYHRAGDLDLIAELGIKTLRYPVLWETIRYGFAGENWRWSDARLTRMRQLGIDPIVGLLHHGFGPRPDLILDPQFPQAFASFAQAVAQRYPWIEGFTPINEPLTTARGSGLYGLWYPHGSDEPTCFRLLVAQCRGVAKATAAIKKVNPSARLVQTEDCGRIFATGKLRYQADYENERRWLALDLLTGRVDRSHRFHERLLAAGVSETELAELTCEPCPPDIIGIDYYLTSDRFLDHRIELYPGERVGGNGSDAYVDIAAVRSVCRDQARLAPRIEEAWKRYGLPLALTEIHNGCTRDEQLRWLIENWRTAQCARCNGIDVRALTAWALFGMVDWNSMLLRHDGYYESGAFDGRCPVPRRTALSGAIATLANGGVYDHPVIDHPGWWRTDNCMSNPDRSMLLSGSGKFRQAFEGSCAARRLSVIRLDANIDIDPELPPTVWASIHIASPEGKAGTEVQRFSCRYADGGRLTVEADSGSNRQGIVDACLDLLIDNHRGTAKLLKTGPANQYEFVLRRTTCS